MIRYPLDAIPTAEAANALLYGAVGAAQAVLDAYNSGAEAETIDALEDTLYGALTVPQECVVAGATLEELENWIDYDAIASGTSDQQLQDMAVGILADVAFHASLGLVVCDELLDHLTEERDSKRAGQTF